MDVGPAGALVHNLTIASQVSLHQSPLPATKVQKRSRTIFSSRWFDDVVDDAVRTVR